MRALLVFNPEATSVSPRVRDVIAHALSSELKLDVAETKRRHHATHLAAGAAHEGYDAVVALGGDGTMNEVVNGLANTGLPLIPIPGGGTNVFARTLGLPRDPIEATSVLLERIRSGAEPRAMNLGSVNGRAFAFCAGIGFDAAVVRAVERRRRITKTIGDPYFIAQAFRLYFAGYPRRTRKMTLRARGEILAPVYEVVVCNTDPYTYMGSRALRFCPKADPQLGLDALALTRMPLVGILRMAARAFTSATHGSMRFVRAFHDLDALTVSCERAVPYQVDGDHAGEGTSFEFRSLEGALRIIA